jgi:hypothetical protein
MLPQPGLQVAACESGVVELAACCVTSQVTSFGVLSFVCPATNGSDSFVGTLAEAGVTVMRTPESMPMVAVPVFFASAVEVAVRVITSPLRSLGKVAGAVKITVRSLEFAGMFPVLSVQGDADEVVVVVPLVVDVVNVQDQVTVVTVAPCTLAEKVCVCVVTSATAAGETETDTVFALLFLLQPDSATQAPATASAAQLKIFRDFIYPASHADSGIAGVIHMMDAACAVAGRIGAPFFPSRDEIPGAPAPRTSCRP